ncbi:MAG: hypothetical protein H7039_02310 [Bryobacteraceae bacterium]|nr:hypothetical protein [Bryobacteraceae bacterium]
MTHQVELSDHVYQIAQQAAAKEGVTLEEWIAATVSRAGSPVLAEDVPGGSEIQPGRATLARYIGGFDSSQETPDPRYRTEVGEIIADKLRRQGLKIP